MIPAFWRRVWAGKAPEPEPTPEPVDFQGLRRVAPGPEPRCPYDATRLVGFDESRLQCVYCTRLFSRKDFT